MSKIRFAPLAIALLATALAGTVWAAESNDQDRQKAAASQSTQSNEAPARAAQDNGATNGATAAESDSATRQQPVAKAPPRRKSVSTAEIDDMNRRYPGG